MVRIAGGSLGRLFRSGVIQAWCGLKFRLGRRHGFDLEAKRLIKRQEYDGRPRTAIKVSSDGKKVFLHQAGNTIDYFDANTLKFEKRVELPGDFTTDLFVFPK